MNHFIAVLEIHRWFRVFKGNTFKEVKDKVVQVRKGLQRAYPHGHFPATYYWVVKEETD